jgi:hypothetical protein
VSLQPSGHQDKSFSPCRISSSLILALCKLQ